MKFCSIRDMAFAYRTPKDRYILNRVAGKDVYGIGLVPYLTGKVVIDIGAHIGSFSVLAASAGARVVAIEPEGSNFDLLQRNVQANRTPEDAVLDIATVSCAIASRPGFHRLFLSEENTGAHSITDARVGSLFQDVVAVRIEDVLDHFKIETCDFLKLDCEGAEEFVLDCVYRSVERFPRIAIEFHDSIIMDNAMRLLAEDYNASPIADSEGFEWNFRLK